jgi:hypothetical protein
MPCIPYGHIRSDRSTWLLAAAIWSITQLTAPRNIIVPAYRTAYCPRSFDLRQCACRQSGSIPSTDRTSGHRCSCPAYVQHIAFVPSATRPLSNLGRKQCGTSGHRCSCPAYRTAYARSEPSASLRRPRSGSMFNTDRTSEHRCSCPAYRTSSIPHVRRPFGDNAAVMIWNVLIQH